MLDLREVLTGIPLRDYLEPSELAAATEFLDDPSAWDSLSTNLRQRLTTLAAPFGDIYAPKARAKTGYIYFVQANTGGPFKIGWAKDPAVRLTALQAAHPYQLAVRAMVRGTRKDETRLHHKLQASRLQGEWFEDTEQVREVVKSVLRTEVTD